MAEKVTIAELGIDLNEVLSQQSKLLAQITAIKEAQKSLKGETNNLTTANDSQRKAYATQEAQLNKLNQEYRINKAVLTEAKTGINSLADALSRENKTVEQARKNNKELTKLRNQQNASTEKGRKNIEVINKRLDENNKFIKENVSGLEKQKINIGNYESALNRLDPRIGGFINGLKGTGQALQTSTSSLKAFRIALAATGIGAIVIALGALISAFASTQRGADEINRALAPLKGAFQGIIGVVQDIALNLFSQLSDRFTIAKNNILAGLELIQLGWAKISGNQEQVERLTKEIRERVKESQSAQERLNGKTAEFSKIWSEAGDNIQRAADSQRQIEELQIAIERKQIDSIVPLARARLEYEKLRAIAQDQANTEQDRIDALNKAQKQQEFISRREQEILDLQIEQLKVKQTQNDTDREGERELQQLLAQRLQAEQAAQRKINTLIAQRSSLQKKIEKDQMAASEEFSEFRVNLENKTAEELFNVNQEQAIIGLDAVKKSQEAQTQKEQEEAKKRIKIKELEEASKRQAALDTLALATQVLGRETAAGKIAASALTLINTYKAATNALASVPFPFNIAAAALTTINGLQNVARINGVQLFADGTERVTGPGTERSDSIPAMLSRNERVVDAKTNRQIGFDLSNSELASAAQMYKFYRLNGYYPVGKQSKSGSPKVNNMVNVQVEDGMKYRVMNKSNYLS